MTHTLILLAIGNLMLLLAIRSLRAQRLKVRHALLFLFLGLPFFGLAAWPDAVGYVGALLGIEASIPLVRGLYYVIKVAVALLLATMREPWPREKVRVA